MTLQREKTVLKFRMTYFTRRASFRGRAFIMSNVFLISLNAIVPICIIMGIGYLMRRCGALEEETVLKMNSVVFRIFLPLMLFQSIRKSDLSATVNPKLFIFTIASVTILIICSIIFTLLTVKDRKKQSVVMMGLFRSNYAIVGLSVAQALAGDQGAATVAVLLAFTTPVYNAVSIIILEMFGGQKTGIKQLFADILKNPLIIACVSGIVFSALKLELPGMLEKVATDMANVATPLALFLLGAFFKFSGLREGLRELIMITLGRLVIVPAIFLTASYLMGFRGAEFVAILCLFAASAAVSSFTMAAELGGDQNLAGNVVIVTSCLFSFTLYCWSVLFKLLGAW